MALKLIRKERLDNPDAVRRFEREVRAAALLSHPNIVHAHDADQIDGTHLLVIVGSPRAAGVGPAGLGLVPSRRLTFFRGTRLPGGEGLYSRLK